MAAPASRPYARRRSIDLDAYGAEAEEFLSSIDREYYLHYSGQQDEFEIEPIYERHAALFSRESVDSLREAGAAPALVEFAVQGLIGQELKAGSAELARREAALELEWDGEKVPFRSTPVLQANEPDPDRRAELEDARNELTAAELNPLTRELLERSHELARELGWDSMRDMCQDLSGTDFGALAQQTERFLADTEDSYEPLVEPELREQLGWASTGCAAPTSPRSSARRPSTPAFRRSAWCRRSPRRSPGWASTWRPSPA